MLNPGTTVGSYRIVRHIGSGGFGAVYEATHAESEDRFALKVTQSENPEAKFLKQLDHPNIPQLVDQFSADEGVTTVTSLVAGDSLAATLGTRKRRTESVVATVRDIASAVACAHRNGIAHRDIKPENILVDSAGHGTLIDWGAACFIDQPVESNAGTVPYIHSASLTKLAGLGSTKSDATWQAQDVYSLGIVLFEAVTGRLPLTRPDEQTSVVTQARQLLGEIPQLQDNIEAATDISATLQSIIIACTDSTDTSYKSCDQLVDDLTAYLDRKPLRHAPESPATSRDRLWRRYRRLLLSIAMIAVISLTVFASDRWNTQSTLSQIQNGTGPQHKDVLSVILKTGIFPDSAELRKRRATTAHAMAARHLRSKQPESAVKLLKAALSLTPRSGELRNDLGTALFELGEFEEAIESFSEALKHPCDHSSVLSNRGAAFAASGDSENARQDFMAALQKNPNHAEARQHLEMLDAVETSRPIH